MRRGEIWWAELPLPTGRRPVVLLSRDSAYGLRTNVTVAVITRTVRNIPVEVLLDTTDGMPQKCVINLDDIITVPKARLVGLVTMLSADKMQDVSRAIIFALDLKA